MTTPPRRDEFDLIASLFAPLARGWPGALGLKDDAALVDVPPGQRLVTTVDAIVAGVHFLPDDPPELVARKLVRVNLSDIAAMGARPFAVLLAAAFPRDATAEWLERFAAGLAADVGAYGVHLIGGDTVATPGPATFSLTAFGLVEPGRELLRAGAGAGDELWVSGTLGDAALGLMVATGALAVREDEGAALLDRYRLPRPRVELGPRLGGLATACMDVSDGLCGDLAHICAASGVGAVVEIEAVPLSTAARAVVERRPELRDRVLGGGDDYELLFTAPPAAAEGIRAAAAAAGVPVARIGRMVAGAGVVVRDGQGREVEASRRGYDHFRETP